MVFRTLTAGAFLIGAPPGASERGAAEPGEAEPHEAEPHQAEPHEEPQLTPSPREIGS